MTLFYPSTFKLLLCAVVFVSCTNTQDRRPYIAEGTIAYPFVAENKALGVNGRRDKFVIRSSVGASEYAVEIPDAGDGYDIQVPLAGLNPASGTNEIGATGTKTPNPTATDKELVTALPSLEKANPNEIAALDSALGVGSPEGPIQSPSYSMGIAKVNQYYRMRNYEVALMEINNLLAFYPNSPMLLKMKGTLLIKTGSPELALRAWQRARDLNPQDSSLARSTQKLAEQISARNKLETQGPKNTLPANPEFERMSH